VARPLRRHGDLIGEQFTPVAAAPDGAVPGEPARGVGGGGIGGIAVPESLLRTAGGGEMRLGRLPGETAFALVWRPAGEPGADWRLLGKHADRESAAAAAHAFAGLLRALGRSCQQLYVVEHNLLRFAGIPGFPYSFTVTAVLSPPAQERNDPAYRDFARQVLRENTPAHIVVRDRFLSPSRMHVFERLYWQWRWALRQGKERAETSAQLIRFLEDAA
jgi:hypothetical protein